MRTINTVFVHCAASRGDVDAQTIDEWHKARGWNGIGYHWVIRQNGRCEPGRPISEVGAHAKGWNSNSVGICLAGGYGGAVDFTAAQWKALEQLVKDLVREHDIQKIMGHNEVSDKSCPNFSVACWAKSFFEVE